MSCLSTRSPVPLWLALVLALAVAGACSTVATASAAPAGPERAIWVWGWVGPQRLARELDSGGFDRAYLYCQGGFDRKVKRTITALRRRGLAVEALAGERNWATTGRDGMTRFVRSAVRYQRRAPAGARLAGVHLDVEPHALKAWDVRPRRTRLAFLAMLRDARRAAGPLTLAADLPFWFDGVPVHRGNRTVTLSGAALRLVDAATIMAYRDRAGDVIRITRRELRQAARSGTALTIGVETGESSPGYVTFLEEGRAALDAALAVIESTLAPARAFAGTAVHSYGSLRTLE